MTISKTFPAQNILRTWNDKDLENYNLLFNPKFVKYLSPKNCSSYYIEKFKNNEVAQLSDITIQSGFNLPKDMIPQFSTFTVDSFYKVHTDYYSEGDILRFINDQTVFFGLKNYYQYITLKDTLIGFLVLCQIPLHPHFKQMVWHIGYWGISPSIQDISIRNFVKQKWNESLIMLNAELPIVANIDYFNISASKMSDNLNFKIDSLRLDARL